MAHSIRRKFAIGGTHQLVPKPALGVSICELRLSASEVDCKGRLVARADGQECMTTLFSEDPLGSPIKIKIEDENLGNQRYFWRQN